jgi:hypothetical protein
MNTHTIELTYKEAHLVIAALNVARANYSAYRTDVTDSLIERVSGTFDQLKE